MASSSTESRALNIVLVMDVSKSMLAQDVAPSRLGRASGLARRLAQDLSGDRMALVVFAGRGYLVSPLTLDESSIAIQLDALDPDMASQGGSGLAAGLDVARGVLATTDQGGDKAVIVFTDGESFEGPSTLEAAGRALGSAGITLIAVPVGDIRGARIPELGGGFHRDAQGKEVITVRRDDLLQAVVTGANGVMIPAGAPDPVGEIRRSLSRLHRSTATDRAAEDLVPRAWIFALIAGLILMAHAATRRSAALVGLLLMLAATSANAQRPTTGIRLLVHGDTTRARQAFLNDARRTQSDTAWFNAGTSALVGGDFPTAIAALQIATLSLNPDLRARALYNLGTANLMQARRDSSRRDSSLSAASSALQAALLLHPGDSNAKFNYELARRLRPPPKPSGGGGRGTPPPKPKPSPSGGGRGAMTKAEAEQVLSAMERAERDTRQAQYQRMGRGEPPRGPDW